MLLRRFAWSLRRGPTLTHWRRRFPGLAGAGGTDWRRLGPYAGTTLVLSLATVALWPVKEGIGLLNISLVFLIIVIGATTLSGWGPGLLAALLGLGLFDFFFVPPYLTFIIGDLHNILALFVFLGVSVLISTLISRARTEAVAADRRSRDVQRLYALGQAALGGSQVSAILPTLITQVVASVDAAAGWIWLPAPGDGGLEVVAQIPATSAPPPAAEELAYSTNGQGVARGLRTGTGSPSGQPDTLCVPLIAGATRIGVVGVTRGTGRRFSEAEQTILVTLADQIALALERLRLLEEANRAELLARTAGLKSALLQAVSHDLRTPLGTIKASVTSLMDTTVTWDAATQRVLLEGMNTECDRLTRLVTNLLDISRIEGGALQLERNWYALDEVVQAARRGLAPHWAAHPLTVDLPADLPLIAFDFVKIEEVLTNLLDNALKYTPPGTPISVRAVADPNKVLVTVADQGPGVAPAELPHLFVPFYRSAPAQRHPGSGLGLAIARGMVEAHGGTLTAHSVPGQGLSLTFTLPRIPPDLPPATETAYGP